MKEKNLHPNNIHNKGYNFDELIASFPKIEPHIIINKRGEKSIDYSKHASVKILNQALLAHYYNIEYWKFPESNLCPAIPGRADYIHHIADLTKDFKNEVKALDIGTGANCIYPILGKQVYNWSFIATDIDQKSIFTAKKIVSKNKLNDNISFRIQPNKLNILKGIIKKDDYFDLSICNPPFYNGEKEAISENERKNKNLKIDANNRNFQGTNNELIYPGGEKAFINNYIYESTFFKDNFNWFTTLIAKKENLNSALNILNKKTEKTEVKVIDMHHGNKKTRILCWKYLK